MMGGLDESARQRPKILIANRMRHAPRECQWLKRHVGAILEVGISQPGQCWCGAEPRPRARIPAPRPPPRPSRSPDFTKCIHALVSESQLRNQIVNLSFTIANRNIKSIININDNASWGRCGAGLNSNSVTPPSAEPITCAPSFTFNERNPANSAYIGQSRSSEFGTHKTAKARFWPWFEPFSGRC